MAQAEIEAIEQSLGDIAQPLIEQLTAARAERASLEATLAQTKDIERRLERTIEHLTGEPAPGKKIHGNAKKSKARPPVSDENVKLVREHFAALDNGADATARETAEDLDLHETTVRNAITVLRADEEIRKTRKRYNRDGQGRGIKPDAYALMNGAHS